jgi:exosome complex RNA-binding protein Csl4
MTLKAEATRKAQGLGHTILTWTPRYGVEVSICDKCGAALCIQSGELQNPKVPYLFGRAVTKLCRG